MAENDEVKVEIRHPDSYEYAEVVVRFPYMSQAQIFRRVCEVILRNSILVGDYETENERRMTKCT